MGYNFFALVVNDCYSQTKKLKLVIKVVVIVVKVLFSQTFPVRQNITRNFYLEDRIRRTKFFSFLILVVNDSYSQTIFTMIIIIP